MQQALICADVLCDRKDVAGRRESFRHLVQTPRGLQIVAAVLRGLEVRFPDRDVEETTKDDHRSYVDYLLREDVNAIVVPLLSEFYLGRPKGVGSVHVHESCVEWVARVQLLVVWQVGDWLKTIQGLYSGYTAMGSDDQPTVLAAVRELTGERLADCTILERYLSLVPMGARYDVTKEAFKRARGELQQFYLDLPDQSTS